jgi:uncharacterized protein (TIGR02270 family)
LLCGNASQGDGSAAGNSRDPRRLAVAALGHLGLPEDVSALLEWICVPHYARLAAEAFTMITGVDLPSQQMQTQRPDGFSAGPTEDPDDDNVELDPDEDLPWPDCDKIAAWWRNHASDFTPGTRYLLGKPITEDWLERVLQRGRQRQRAAAALELAIRRHGTPLFEVRAPGFRQQQLLF